MRNNGKNDKIYFWRAPESLQMVTTAMKLKDTCFLEDKLDGMLKSRDNHSADKGPCNQYCGFPVVMMRVGP